MKILVTGANGFVGKNLVASLEAIRDGKDHVHQIEGREKELKSEPLEIISYDKESSKKELEAACKDCNFVFHLAGVNRTEDQEEFIRGNVNLGLEILDLLRKYHNTCPIMLSSSIQASLIGRYEKSDYGRSKREGEKLFFQYGAETGADVLVYRFPNVFGKWCRPNYNSVVATFCHNIANDLPIRIDDRTTELDLVYIDDLIEEMLSALNGLEHRCEWNGFIVMPKKTGKFCYVPHVYKVTLGEIADLLEQFQREEATLSIPVIPDGSFIKKLYSAYLSYLPEKKVKIPVKMNIDARGSFTELIHTLDCGQVSINIANPSINRGQHWHHSKWEIFFVVAGEGLIRQRKIGSQEIIDTRVSGKKIEAVRILPGYAHCIINLSDTENLVTVMWANELFDREHPDTFSENV